MKCARARIVNPHRKPCFVSVQCSRDDSERAHVISSRFTVVVHTHVIKHTLRECQIAKCALYALRLSDGAAQRILCGRRTATAIMFILQCGNQYLLLSWSLQCIFNWSCVIWRRTLNRFAYMRVNKWHWTLDWTILWMDFGNCMFLHNAQERINLSSGYWLSPCTKYISYWLKNCLWGSITDLYVNRHPVWECKCFGFFFLLLFTPCVCVCFEFRR